MKRHLLSAFMCVAVVACSSTSGDIAPGNAEGTDNTSGGDGTEGVNALDGADGSAGISDDEWAALMADVPSAVSISCGKFFSCGVNVEQEGFPFLSEEECNEQAVDNLDSIRTNMELADPTQCLIDQLALIRCANDISCEEFVEYVTSDTYAGECVKLENVASCNDD